MKRCNLLNALAIIFSLAISINLNGQNSFTPTKVLILGTHHLSQIKGFELQMLTRVIKKLDSYKFDAVCIENMPGELLYDIQSRSDSSFIDVLKYFGGERLKLAKLMQKKNGVSFNEAEKKISEMLKQNQFTDKERILLIKYFVGATDLASAALHFSYIQDTTALKSSDIPPEVIKTLQESMKSANEIYSLAIKLAYNRHLNKLEYIDNFQDEALLLKYFPAFLQDYQNNAELFKDLPKADVFVKTNDLVKKGIEDKDLFNLYSFLNSKEYMEQDYNAQWKIWLKTNFPTSSDRARYSLWEMRNLQIAANIVKTCAFYPGKNVLVIIGASHKSFIEKYLDQIPDINLLKFE